MHDSRPNPRRAAFWIVSAIFLVVFLTRLYATYAALARLQVQRLAAQHAAEVALSVDGKSVNLEMVEAALGVAKEELTATKLLGTPERHSSPRAAPGSTRGSWRPLSVEADGVFRRDSRGGFRMDRL